MITQMRARTPTRAGSSLPATAGTDLFPRRDPRRERGFTLIELLVACILMLAVFGVAGQFLLQSFAGSGGAASGAVSDAMATVANQQLRDDLARAVTDDLRDGLVRDPTGFARAVRDGSDLPDPRPGQSGNLDIDTITVATPTMLRFTADVNRAAGTECVSWLVEGGDLVRNVGQFPACGKGLGSEVMLRTTAARPFRYQLVCAPGACPNSNATASAPCRPWTDQTVASKARRRWIVGVGAEYRQLTTGSNAAQAAGSGYVTITSREVQSYRRALGC